MLRSATPAIDFPTQPLPSGRPRPSPFTCRAKNGVHRAAAYLEQNGARYQVWSMTQPSKTADNTWTFTAGIKTTPQLRDGKATLIVEASSNDLRGKTAHLDRDVNVVSQPPTVSVDSDQHYLYLGMADLATFNVVGQLYAGGRAGGRPDIPRLAHARRKKRAVLAVRLRVEHAAGHDSRGLCVERRRQRRDQPDQFPVPEERTAALHRARPAGERRVHAEGGGRD